MTEVPAGNPFGTHIRARELTLKFLYACDLGQEGGPDAFETFATHEDIGGVVREHARELVRGVMREREAIDTRLRAIAKNWTLERMAAIDRNVLRIGAYELIHAEGTSPALIIDSAIELSKRYSTEHSGRFVNGILDRVKDDLARARASATPDSSEGS